MASILLPAIEWTDSCQQLVDQKTEDDEIIVACDSADQPIVEQAADKPVTVVVAGEPDGCSGKCNALAAALEAVSDDQDLIILTDDDLERDDDWLEYMKTKTREHGAYSTVPTFYSESVFGLFLEAAYTPMSYIGMKVGETIWPGAAGFKRENIDMDGLIDGLRRTLIDTAVLPEYVSADDGKAVPCDMSISPNIPVEGTFDSDFRKRGARIARTFWLTDRSAAVMSIGISAIVLLGLLIAPLVAAAITTGIVAVTYVLNRFPRWTFVFAPVSLVLWGVMMVYGVPKEEIEWGGRKYRWSDKYQVEILSE